MLVVSHGVHRRAVEDVCQTIAWVTARFRVCRHQTPRTSLRPMLRSDGLTIHTVLPERLEESYPLIDSLVTTGSK